MITVKGYVSRIIYRNSDTGYTVMTLDTEQDDVCCVGVMAFFDEGEYLEITGEETFHPQYGDQIKVTKVASITPTSAVEMQKYLASGAIVGVGAALAERIVKRFGDDTFRIMEEEPERLAEVKGISEAGAMRISDQFAKKQELRNAMIFLQQYGISNNLAVKIYNFYGERMYKVLRENPYRLAEDISGVGFKIADEIAMKAGVSPHDDFRVKAAVYYTLSLATGNGHVYLPVEKLFEKTREIIDVTDEAMERQLTALALERKVVLKDEDTRNAYIASFYYMELNVARMLCDLNINHSVPDKKIRDRLRGITAELPVEPDELQVQAVTDAVQHGVFVLTGGPGTGKTTTINTIIRFFDREGMEVLLAAPTGRAAKRMSEATGREAKTIHRLLELQRKPDDNAGNAFGSLEFAKNDSNPLEADAIIIDEASMVDISLMHALLKAVTVGTRLILVGDRYQLPSVGPGNVLRDIIASQRFHVACLERIFRQAAESSIIVNAHKINRGEAVSLDNRVNNDFFFLGRSDVFEIVDAIKYLVTKKLPGYLKVSPLDIQVLTPMKAGELGTEKLNQTLQDTLNPASPGKAEHIFDNGKVIRTGDKVMQIKNNYQLQWEVRSRLGNVVVESGTGVFNGDCGTVYMIDNAREVITVEFEDGHRVEYQFSQHDELALAYAITIHKSQGSEYPAVVLPLLTGPRMLFNRNVLYTAVTRAKRCVTIIGSADTVGFMIGNTMEQKRYSGLERAIREVEQ